MKRGHHPRAEALYSPHQFAIVFQDRLGRNVRRLTTVMGANDATMAFHVELRRLQAVYATGQLMIVKNDDVCCPVLRQSLGPRSIDDSQIVATSLDAPTHEVLTHSPTSGTGCC